ncbi:unnamed protein product [Anisakis simplex]|uniref:tRNA-synt_1g domain-containing protein n=1 Tax=Anisakis simplex TaxID=6269 RepID=A0A0M3JPC7_ANISI|nr:unnamed protein product [Anisakis simplex]
MSLKRHEFSTTAFVFNDLRAYGFAIFDFLTRPENKAKADETYRWLQVHIVLLFYAIGYFYCHQPFYILTHDNDPFSISGFADQLSVDFGVMF